MLKSFSFTKGHGNLLKKAKYVKGILRLYSGKKHAESSVSGGLERQGDHSRG